MGRQSYNEQVRRILEGNPNVRHVSEKTIQYTPEFKLKAVKAHREGKTPYEIFLEAGLDPKIIGTDLPAGSLKRWRKTVDALGEDALLTERRGRGSTGRPTSGSQSAEDRLKKAEARIKYLEAELDLVKKLEAAERRMRK
ncbi:HTH domain-containing protein [Bhargavaea ullalensis]